MIAFNRSKTENLAALLPQLPDLQQADAETLAAAMFEPSGYDFFQPSDFTYRSMQESGDFRLLSDGPTKTALLRLVRRYREIELLQMNFIQALDDAYIPLVMRDVDILQMRLANPELLDNLVFRNFFAFAIEDTGQRMKQYENARDQASALLGQIQAQMR